MGTGVLLGVNSTYDVRCSMFFVELLARFSPKENVSLFTDITVQ
jgi:hypothetical protein